MVLQVVHHVKIGLVELLSGRLCYLDDIRPVSLLIIYSKIMIVEINNSIMLLCVLQRTREEVEKGPHGDSY